MGIISTLAISLVARTEKFTKGLSSAKKQVRGFSADLGRATAFGAKFGGAVAAIAGTAGLVGLVNQEREAIDATGKLADLFALTTEQLVGYEHASSLAGVTNEQLNTSLRNFQKNIALARDGSKSAADAFANMGLDPDALGLMSTDQALKTVADRLPQITDDFTRTQAALALFGRSGLPFIKVLQEGGAGLERAQEEAAKLGLAFDRVDAAKVELANDAVTRMQSVFAGVGRTIAIEVSPYIQAFAEYITAAGTAGEGMGVKVTAAMESVTSQLRVAVGIFDIFAAGWNTIIGTIEFALSAVLKFSAKVQESFRDITSFLAGKNTSRGPNLLRETGDAFEVAAGRAFDQVAVSSASLADIATGAASNRLQTFFDDINARAQAAAEQAASVAGLPSNAGGADPGAGKAAASPFAAQQTNLANVFVGALKSSKRDRQATEDAGTHTRLDKLVRAVQASTRGAVTV